MMAYRKNFVVAVKHRGRILREIDEVVTLPFGSEYSILLKNKDSRKAVATIEIDGVDVVDGKRLIVDPNSTIELKGFMKGSSVRNKFKFIEKTKEISNYRGDRIDDGLVRVEFWFEKEKLEIPDIKYNNDNIWYSSPMPPTFGPQSLYNTTTIGNSISASARLTKCCSNDNGITVKGSETHQGFSMGVTDTLENKSTVITINLRGLNKRTNKVIKKAVGVKTRLVCSTCGSKSKSSAKFCRSCGTYIQ